jgi:membrane protein implicated in regulation of membrane protease activity
MIVYATIAAVGFVILLVMLFTGDVLGGGHDVDLHGGAFGEADADHGGPGIFSLRIMASFITAFGVGGVVGRYLGLSHPAASGVGIVSGIVLSGIVYQFARLLYSQQASSEIQMARLVGHPAEVSVAIPANGVGQVVLSMAGERSEHIARSQDGKPLPRGAGVVITALTGDSVVVSRGPGGST